MNTVTQTRLTTSALVVATLMLAFAPPFAQGGIIYSGTSYDLQVSAPIDVGIALKAVTVTVIGKTSGILPTTFDSEGLTGITTTGNALHQIYEYDGIDWLSTPTLTLNTPGSIPQNLDTHFLVQSDDIAPIKPPKENRAVLYSVEDPHGSFGNSLTGVFSPYGTPSSTTWDFAYLVVPANAQLKFQFRIWDTTGLIQETINTSCTVAVPEPSSLALLAAGCVGLLFSVRRRK